MTIQEQKKSKNIFVLGEDAFNELHNLRPLTRTYGYNFRCLTQWSESKVSRRGVLETLEIARRRLRAFDGRIDGLITFFDFPVSLLAPILCREFDLPSPSVEAVLSCEHKYWSRTLQQKAAPEVVPHFSKLDPQEDSKASWDRLMAEDMTPPFWIKPAKGVLGEMAYRIEDRQQLVDAIEQVRGQVDRFAEPLAQLLDSIDVSLPEGMDAAQAARLFMVEEDIEVPLACTVEGHCFDREVFCHGIVDSFRYPDQRAFHRFQYPSKLPEPIQQRMIDASGRVMRAIGFDDGAFNIEFFWDPNDDRISLLEINPRISQSHSPQFAMVDGDANMKIIADLALATKPILVRGAGEHKIAAKLMLRVFVEDGIVTRTPGEAEREAVRRRFPGTLIRSSVTLGQRLSEQKHVDNYSWELAEIYMGGRNEEELLTHFNEAAEILDFRIDGDSVRVPDARDAILEIANP